VICIFAPAGIGEIAPGTDLVAAIVAAVTADPSGPLVDGDIVVLTSKVVSKAEGRSLPADQRDAAIDDESRGTVARRGATRIVRTRHGLTLAAAGVDTSNVAPESILLLPVDPDASADRLRSGLEEQTGTRLGVVISDTAGRAWRIGQTDQAIGASGVRVIERYEGRRDGYGNELQVTAIAIADELASAADLVKAKLSGRPVAVLRGLGHHLAERAGDLGADTRASDLGADTRASDLGADTRASDLGADTRASDLVRDAACDLFRYGSREAVVAAVLDATGQSDRYEETLRITPDEALVAAVVAGSGRTGPEADLLADVLSSGLGLRPPAPPRR
jgi:coenzyme F420-0:L-glutamate ligase/coenzyme F420-1:gamma-L-glutamate ligase